MAAVDAELTSRVTEVLQKLDAHEKTSHCLAARAKRRALKKLLHDNADDASVDDLMEDYSLSMILDEAVRQLQCSLNSVEEDVSINDETISTEEVPHKNNKDAVEAIGVVGTAELRAGQQPDEDDDRVGIVSPFTLPMQLCVLWSIRSEMRKLCVAFAHEDPLIPPYTNAWQFDTLGALLLYLMRTCGMASAESNPLSRIQVRILDSIKVMERALDTRQLLSVAELRRCLAAAIDLGDCLSPRVSAHDQGSWNIIYKLAMSLHIQLSRPEAANWPRAGQDLAACPHTLVRECALIIRRWKSMANVHGWYCFDAESQVTDEELNNLLQNIS